MLIYLSNNLCLKLLQRLLTSLQITRSSLDQAPKQQGAYVLWYDDNPSVCLKVGIAGPRQGRGLKGRLSFHYSSNLNSSILAKHMEADVDFGRTQGYDFRKQQQRKHFLAEKCFFQTMPLPTLSRKELKQLEDFIAAQLKPRYLGRVT